MSNVSELPCRHRQNQSSHKMLFKAQAKTVMRLVAPPLHWEHTDTKTAGVLAGTNPLVSSTRNSVSPISRLRKEAGVPARAVVGVAGKGGWRKRRPVCNGSDRRCAGNGNIALSRKRAHFQLVVRDERDCRTVFGGNRK